MRLKRQDKAGKLNDLDLHLPGFKADSDMLESVIALNTNGTNDQH